MTRWIVYQRERFPLLGHGPLVAAFSASAVCFSRLLRGGSGFPAADALLVAFITALLFFLQLRITDEFKDFEDDSRYRPYRPVPRGLVTLPELARVGIGAGMIQLAAAVWLDAALLWLLLLGWGYLGLMAREFFVPRWLKARPVVYMASHMVVIPLIDLFATACDWRLAGLAWPPEGLVWFLLVSYFNGVVVEVGRKIRAPADEETGVETYTSLWGIRGALTVWLAAVAITALFAWQAARQVRFEQPMTWMLLVLFAMCATAAARFRKQPGRGSGKAIEMVSGAWTLLMYLGLGVLPVLFWSIQAP